MKLPSTTGAPSRVAYVAAALRDYYRGELDDFLAAIPPFIREDMASRLWDGGEPYLDAYLASCATVRADPVEPWKPAKLPYPGGLIEWWTFTGSIRLARKEQGIGIQEAGRVIDVPCNFWRKLERKGSADGMPRARVAPIMAICDFLELDPHAYCDRSTPCIDYRLGRYAEPAAING